MSGTTQVINFGQIPLAPNWLVPGSYLEIVAKYQNVGILPIPARSLIIAQSTSAGTATVNTLIQNVTRPITATGLGGPGSQIDAMVKAYLDNNQTVPLDIICVPDAVGATAAVWTHTFTGPVTQGGQFAMNIEGQRVTIGSVAGDTATVAATEWAAAINAMPSLPVTATAAIGVVTVTAKNKGISANDISFIVSPAAGDVLPPGLACTVAATTPGATNPDVSAALALVSGLWYTDIIVAWQDTTNIGECAAEAIRRFNAMVHLDARFHIGITGTFSQQLSTAHNANSKFVQLPAFQVPGSAPWRLAAAAGGISAQRLTDDPSRQMDQIAMVGIVGPQRANLPDDNEKELLIAGGVPVFHVAADSSVSMHRYVSSYTTDAQGNLDTAWRDVMRQAVSSRIRYDWKAYFRAIYPSNKLAPDDSLAAQTDPTVCTPRRAAATWAARMIAYAKNGWVVDEINQARAATFFINPNDVNRLDYAIPYTQIGNLMVDAGQLQFNA